MTTMTSFYPVLMVEDVAANAAFYTEHLGFAQTFAADWYVSLRHGDFELALLRFDHATIPAGYGRPAAGLLLNYEVEDARAAYARLVERARLSVALDIRDEAFGQRHFIVEAPEGVLVDVIENIPATGEYADAYAGA